MAAGQIDFLLTPFVSANGSPLSGGTVEIYEAGTSTPVDVYAEQSLTTNLGSTVTLDSRGTALAFADGTELLKLIVKDSGGTTLKTYDGVSYASAVTTSGDFYKKDGSEALTGDIPMAGYDINNAGDINIGASKNLNINHGHAYTPVGGDQVVYGGSTGYVRQFVASSLGQLYFGATKIYDFLATAFDLYVPLDMNSNKITALATGTAGTDATNLTQVQAEANLVKYDQGLTQVYAATAATGDGTGVDASNKISYANLFGADGLLYNGRAYEINLTDTTISISAGISIPSGGPLVIRSSGAVTASDAWTITGRDVKLYQATGTSSYNWSFSSSLTVGDEALIDTGANIAVTGNVTTNGNIITGGTFSSNDLNMGRALINSTGAVTVGGDLDMSGFSYLVSPSSISVTGNALLSRYAQIENTLTFSCVNLDVTSHSSIGVGGNITITGTLDVSGHSRVQSLAAMTITGAFTCVNTSYISSSSRTDAGGTADSGTYSWASPA